MIVIGYQGIGKSTLADNELSVIDLESGNFWIDGKRSDDWYKPYCKIAIDLSKQGYIVLTSSHEVVRRELLENPDAADQKIYACHPVLALKDEWIERLAERYAKSKSEKDYKAWKNAEDRYTENITELMNSGFDTLPIDSMDYDLTYIIFEVGKGSKWAM